MTPSLSSPCAFDCDCNSIQEIMDVLNAAGAGTWQLHIRDSVWYPDYLTGKLAEGVEACLIDGVPSTEGMAEGQFHMLRENLEATREGRPRPHNLSEARFKLLVTSTSASQEEMERLVRGMLERLGARNIGSTSSDWFQWS
jgi:hypothetical protein